MKISRRIVQWLARPLLLLGLLAGVSLAYSAPAPAGGEVSPEWVRELPNRSDSLNHFSSPVLADLNDDGKLDIVVATNRGIVLAFAHVGGDLVELWRHDVAADFGKPAGTQIISSSPAVADLDGNGTMEVAVGVGADGYACQGGLLQGGMVVMNHLGQTRPGWPKETFDFGGNGCSDPIFSSPALGDIDGDGDLEIVAGSFDKRIYAWHHNGAAVDGFPANSYHIFRFPDWGDTFVGKLADSVWGSPALADLNGDNKLDILIGTDEGNFDGSYPGNSGGWECPYTPPVLPGYCGGSFYGLMGNGQVLPGFPMYIYEHIQSTAAVADVLAASAGPEIFVGTGTYYHNNAVEHPTTGFRVYGLTASGQPLPGWEGGKVVGESVPSSPVLGDITGDSRPEVIAVAYHERLYAWDLAGNLVFAPVVPRDYVGHTADFDAGTGLVLANFDGDAKMEIILNVGWSPVVIDGNGQHLTSTGGGDGRPFYSTNSVLLNTPAVGNIDNDAELELIANNGELFVWEWSTTGPADWPMWKRNAARTSALPLPPRLGVMGAEVAILHKQGSGGQADGWLSVINEGQQPLEWDGDGPNGVSLTPAAGTLDPGERVVIRLRVNPAGYGPGTYELGNLTITASDENGIPALGSPAKLMVKLVVGNITDSYLPIVKRN